MIDALQYLDTGKRLRAIRGGFSEMLQTDWALRHGWRRTQVNNRQTGTRRIPVEAAIQLCDLYGLSLDFIYRGRRDGLSENASKRL